MAELISLFELENHVDFASLDSLGRLRALRLFAQALAAVVSARNEFIYTVVAAGKKLSSTPLQTSDDAHNAMEIYAAELAKAADACVGKENGFVAAMMAALGDCGLKVSSDVTKQ